MKTLFRWLVRIAGAALAVALAIAGYVFLATEYEMRRKYDAPLRAFSAPQDAESVRHGRRLAVVHGCTVCHGAQLQGRVMFDEPGVARIRTPNVVRTIRDYSDSELERLLRRGVKRDNTGVWVMPAATHLADDDLGAIIAYVRSIPEQPGETTELRLRPLARIGIATGRFEASAAQVDVSAPPVPLDRSDALSLGRYLVTSACTECHGQQLQGTQIAQAPGLLVAAAYREEQDFMRLMRTGVGLGGRDLGKMSAMGRERFASFTDDEIRAVRTYLQEFVRRGGTSMP